MGKRTTRKGIIPSENGSVKFDTTELLDLYIQTVTQKKDRGFDFLLSYYEQLATNTLRSAGRPYEAWRRYATREDGTWTTLEVTPESRSGLLLAQLLIELL
jgi:hypothetical protein